MHRSECSLFPRITKRIVLWVKILLVIGIELVNSVYVWGYFWGSLRNWRAMDRFLLRPLCFFKFQNREKKINKQINCGLKWYMIGVVLIQRTLPLYRWREEWYMIGVVLIRRWQRKEVSRGHSVNSVIGIILSSLLST